MGMAAMLAGHPLAVPNDRSSSAVAARDAALAPKLVAAAHSFEASLMQELLKPLSAGGEFGGGGFGGDDDGGGGAGAGGLGGLASSADGSGGALMSFGSEALASALSEKGGLGIARRILDHFESVAAANGKPDTTSELPKPGAKASPEKTRGDENRRVEFQDGIQNRY